MVFEVSIAKTLHYLIDLLSVGKGRFRPNAWRLRLKQNFMMNNPEECSRSKNRKDATSDLAAHEKFLEHKTGKRMTFVPLGTLQIRKVKVMGSQSSNLCLALGPGY